MLDEVPIYDGSLGTSWEWAFKKQMLSTSNSLLTDHTLGLYLILNTPLHQLNFSSKPILNHQPTNNRVSRNCLGKPKHPPPFHLRCLDLIQFYAFAQVYIPDFAGNQIGLSSSCSSIWHSLLWMVTRSSDLAWKPITIPRYTRNCSTIRTCSIINCFVAKLVEHTSFKDV